MMPVLCPVLYENRWGTNLNLQLQPWKRMRYKPVEFVDVGISSDNKELTRHGHSTTPCFTNENADLTCIYLQSTSIYCIWYCITQRCWCDQNEALTTSAFGVLFLVVPSRRATIQGVESEQDGIGKLFTHKLRLWCSCTSPGCSHRMPDAELRRWEEAENADRWDVRPLEEFVEECRAKYGELLEEYRGKPTHQIRYVLEAAGISSILHGTPVESPLHRLQFQRRRRCRSFDWLGAGKYGKSSSHNVNPGLINP